MDALDNKINKRILSGYFPTEKLYPVDDYSPTNYDFALLAENGLNILKQYPEIMYGLFTAYKKRVSEQDSINRPEYYTNSINVLINTEYKLDDLNALDPTVIEATNLCPAITKIDKILWVGASDFYFSNSIISPKEQNTDFQDMAFSWIHLLKTVQKKETQYGLSINTNSISPKTNIIKLIESDWSKVDKKYFLKITDLGKKKFRELNKTIEKITTEISNSISSQIECAKATKSEWHTFLEIMNDLSQKENNVVSLINHSGSPKDKIRIINNYNSILYKISKGNYVLNDESIYLLDIFDAVYKRFNTAASFCVAKTEHDKVFHLNPGVFYLAINPQTYNYLFISFHSFRLNPRKDTAKEFFSLALSILKRNLGFPDDTFVSLDEIIEEFYTTVTAFIDENRVSLENLSFNKIREDIASLSPEFSFSDATEYQKIDLANRIKEFTQSENFEKEIEKIFFGKGRTLSKKEILESLQAEEERFETIEKNAFAGKIITSLNIIYMFCDALRIVLNNRHASIKIKNRDTVSKYRNELMKIDDTLIHKVYSNLDEQEIGMLEYREKMGLSSQSLTEQELEEEKFRNETFGDILKNSITTLIDDIENQESEGILNTKAKIRKEILRFPNCDEKERYINWIDNISHRLSNVLISNCKKDNDYQTHKTNIINSLGDKSSILPNSTLDSLTTAEMLYSLYATDEYADKGFDFSCISALYYQAFEEAYNTLIWRGYSEELNLLEINNQKYTDILESCRNQNINITDAIGYLEQDRKQRSYYVIYKNNTTNTETRVNTRCMYKSFAILLKNITPNTRLIHFCEYIARITGFSNTHDMFNDTDFMRNLNSFIATVDASADSRNNASHGGTFISIEQCKSDKKTVLSELEAVRSDSLGLIQQLLFLLNK